MRIVSYNILDGGEGRADPLAEVILAQRPDVVALVEAENQQVVARIARRLEMDSIVALGNSHASALLSRWPIVQTINHAALRPAVSNSLLETIVQAPDATWTIGVIHLHAHASDEDERIRQQEIAAALEAFAPHRRDGTPHLLVGDFNSNSPFQQIQIARCKPSTQQEWEANGKRIPRAVIQTLLDGGYVDTLAASDPQAAAHSGTFSTQYPGQRVDYIFAWGLPPQRIRSAWIEHDRLARYASDHFPIGAELA